MKVKKMTNDALLEFLKEPHTAKDISDQFGYSNSGGLARRLRIMREQGLILAIANTRPAKLVANHLIDTNKIEVAPVERRVPPTSERDLIKFLSHERSYKDIQQHFNLKSYGSLCRRLGRLEEKGVIESRYEKRTRLFITTNSKDLKQETESLQQAVSKTPKVEIHALLDDIILSVTKLRQFISDEGVAQTKLEELKALLKEE